MKFFPFGTEVKDDTRFGVVVDIGSASVAAAVVASDPKERYPSVLWSHREYLPETKGIVDTEKRLRGTILNVFLELGAMGLKTFREKHPGQSIKLIQVSIASPFSYTLTRNISTKSDKGFVVTKRLVKELESKAAAEAKKHADTKLVSRSLDLSLLSNSTVALTLNGYMTKYPFGSTAKDVSLCQMISLTTTTFKKELENARDKILPTAKLDIDSFMSLYFRALSHITKNLTDASLISVTAEATEIAVVREGLPLTSASISSGAYSVARKVSTETKLPFVEALGLLRDNSVDNTKRLSAEKKEKIEKIITAYETQLAGLFKSTGDALSIPKTIYLHTDKANEAFFAERLKKAAELATGMKHQIRLVTSELFGFEENQDSAILCSAYVFHQKLYEDDYLED